MEYLKLLGIVFVILTVIVVIMSIGVIRGRKPIAGSCGGLNNAMQSEDGKCLTCGTQIDKESSDKLRK
ncbi:MAG: (Na+)-NQR maturation NqrM, partial [Alphaproteobacteria bacterium]